MESTELMTGYEKRVYNGWKKTAADELKDKKMLELTLKKVLAHEVATEITLETGEVVNLPILDVLVLKKLGYDLEHPEKIDLKVYSAVLGETKQELNLGTNESASELFKGVAAGAKPDGSSSRQPQSSDSK